MYCWMTINLPSLCNIAHSNYAITCGAMRRKTTLLRVSVRDRRVGLIIARMTCANTFSGTWERAVLFTCSYSNLIFSLYLYRSGLIMPWCHSSGATSSCQTRTMITCSACVASLHRAECIHATWSGCLTHFHLSSCSWILDNNCQRLGLGRLTSRSRPLMSRARDQFSAKFFRSQ